MIHHLARWPTQLLAGTLLLATASGAGAQMYRWVDDDGQVHFSDTPPTDAGRYDREVLDRRGLVVERLERAQTAEEREREQARQAAEAETARREAEQARADRILLQSFGSERELLHARDDRLDIVDGNLNLMRNKLSSLQEQHEEALGRAQRLRSQDRELPENLQRRLGSLERQILRQEEQLVARQQEREALVERFNRDLQRLRQLRQEREDPAS
ncbi:DUF4124 domain-containing protein [Ectothiorhodospira sp. 9100]|uniref:DUF4124 domain-containing protein n=1 Tax=unclassified Ectothiorhodospira TaxID=2684909 RepID=UPI001EE8F020|nr:DUF4124 domain-containing protein [Ectothiorhodospira sp. 9100]MCG5518434.1 DUF4124 domain-containing protein [Ectothiorhodospira sp. 9905]